MLVINILNYTLSFLSIVCFAKADAFLHMYYNNSYLKNYKVKSKNIKLLAIFFTLCLIIPSNYIYINQAVKTFIAHGFIWITFYDACYNISRGWKYLYYGKTSGWYTRYRRFMKDKHIIIIILSFFASIYFMFNLNLFKWL
jgi:hypothetical protein